MSSEHFFYRYGYPLMINGFNTPFSIYIIPSYVPSLCLHSSIVLIHRFFLIAKMIKTCPQLLICTNDMSHDHALSQYGEISKQITLLFLINLFFLPTREQKSTLIYFLVSMSANYIQIWR